MTKEEFIAALKDLNIEVDLQKLLLLEKYYEELITYNKHTNLTAITQKEDVYLKHFYDSLTVSKIINLKEIDTVLDIGSGAGFPGIVLKIFYPHLQVTLIDSNNKKTTFLTTLISKLNLGKIEVVHDRVENYARKHLNAFDLVTARAVKELNILAELALPLVKIDKYFLAMKGNVKEEIVNGTYAINFLKGKIVNQISFYLNHKENLRTLILVQKVAKTELNQLRSFEKIIKKPLQKR